MNVVANLVRRNASLYWRNRMGVVLSLLAPLILIALYTLFLGSLQVENIEDRLPGASRDAVHGFIDSWVIAGIVMITTLTAGLGTLNVFVDDAQSTRFRDFIVAPVSRWQLVTGYLITSVLVSFGISLVTLLGSEAYLAMLERPAIGAEHNLRLVGYVFASCVVFSALSSFAITFIKTSGAFSALNTIVGTAVGFLAIAYIPAGSLPSGVVTVMNYLPFAQAASVIRGPLTEESLNVLTDSNAPVEESVRAFYGIVPRFGDVEISPLAVLAIFAAVFVVFLALAIHRIGRKIR